MNKAAQNKGFSLIEMAIVIVIISLTIAGIIAGKSLVSAGKINAALSEYTQLESYINLFQNTYSFLPGDFPDATQYWPGSHNGNGNGALEFWPASETPYHWQVHLNLAGILSSPPPARCQHDTPEGISCGYPTQAVSGKKFGWNIASINNELYASLSSGSSTSTGWIGGSISPKIAKLIDSKADDGIANSGLITAINAHYAHVHFGTNRCINGSSQYAISQNHSDPICVLQWKF